MHFDEGQLRAFLDGQQPAGVSDHLETCPRCRARLDELSAQSQRVTSRLSTLDEPPSGRSHSLAAGRARLAGRLTQDVMEEPTMFSKLLSPRSRPVWAGLALIAVLAVALAFPSVRAIANSFLGLFRVQQVSVVSIDPSTMRFQLGGSDQFEAMLSEDVSFSEGGESQPAADAAEAAALAGFAVRLPTAEFLGEPELIVQAGGSATYTIDQPRLQALLAAIGRSDISLPGELNGAAVTLTIPPSVAAAYNDCYMPKGAPGRAESYDPHAESLTYPICTTLIQMPSPTIDAPEGLDLRALGEAYLQILGMDQAAAANFAANIDWATTLVIPIPSDQATYRDVSVDGAPATLIETSGSEYGFQEYMLIWVKDGIVHALTGSGGASQALTLAESLK